VRQKAAQWRFEATQCVLGVVLCSLQGDQRLTERRAV